MSTGKREITLTLCRLGVEPRRIDIITSIDGLGFDEAWANAVLTEIDGVMVRVLSKSDIIINKLAAGRTKDMADAELLIAAK